MGPYFWVALKISNSFRSYQSGRECKERWRIYIYECQTVLTFPSSAVIICSSLALVYLVPACCEWMLYLGLFYHFVLGYKDTRPDHATAFSSCIGAHWDDVVGRVKGSQVLSLIVLVKLSLCVWSLQLRQLRVVSGYRPNIGYWMNCTPTCLEVDVFVAVDERGEDVMSDEICRRYNRKQQRRCGGRNVQLPDWFMILHSSFETFMHVRVYVRTTYDQIYSAKKKENSPEVRSRDGHVEHVCKISESYLLKTAWTFGLLCGKHVYLRSCF